MELGVKLITARVYESTAATTSPDSPNSQSIQKEDFWEITLEDDRVSISRTKKSERTSGLETIEIENLSWTLTNSASHCIELVSFQGDQSLNDFISLSKEITGSGWSRVAESICATALWAKFEAILKSQGEDAQGLPQGKTEQISMTYDASTEIFIVKGEEREFWELPIPEAVITIPQLRELLAKRLSTGLQRHVLEILVDLGARQIQDLVENIRLLYSVPFVHAPELVCGTEAMNQDPGGFIGWLLRPSRRKK